MGNIDGTRTCGVSVGYLRALAGARFAALGGMRARPGRRTSPQWAATGGAPRNVAAFQALSANLAYVLRTDSKLWLETAPWVTVPPFREQVDGNVSIVGGTTRLASWSSTPISARQVTQRNAGCSTAGIGGEVATPQARTDVAARVHQSCSSWNPRAVRLLVSPISGP